MKSTPKQESNGKETTKRFILYAISLIVCFAIILIFIYFNLQNTTKKRITYQEKEIVKSLKDVIDEDFRSINSDLKYLAQQLEFFHNYNDKHESFTKYVSESFLQFSTAKNIYDQIRFIDSTGMEVIRVNYNLGQPSVVPEWKLQDKSKRYYFKDVFSLNKNQVFISPLDLNIENSEIEQPLKPMIRIGTPVFDENENKIGIVLLNYLGNDLLNRFKNLRTKSNGDILLINPDGYFFIGLTPKDEWGFMYDDKKDRTLESIFPNEWILMIRENSFSTKNGIFNSSTIYPLQETQTSSTGSTKAFEASKGLVSAGETYWKAISFVSKKNLARIILPIFKLWGHTFIITSVFMLIVLWFLSRTISQKKAANRAIIKKNISLEEQKKEITDSLQYANRIQSAMIPSDEYIREILNDYFIVYKPKHIVSGDFYWIGQKDGKIIVVGADCTGHGVPGAFMSMLGISILNDIISEHNITSPDEILNSLREHIISALKQNYGEGELMDGMDVAAFTLDPKSRKIEFAGANNPLYLIADHQLIETKGDKMPVAIYKNMYPFTKHEFTVNKGDTIYIFSDGYADQFGGPKGKKFKYQAFRNTLLNIKDSSMLQQKITLEKTFEEWKNHTNPNSGKTYEQVDDVLVMGIKI